MDRTEAKGVAGTMTIGVETETITTGGAAFPFHIDSVWQLTIKASFAMDEAFALLRS